RAQATATLVSVAIGIRQRFRHQNLYYGCLRTWPSPHGRASDAISVVLCLSDSRRVPRDKIRFLSNQSSVSRTEHAVHSDPSDESLGYWHSSATRTGQINLCARRFQPVSHQPSWCQSHLQHLAAASYVQF